MRSCRTVAGLVPLILIAGSACGQWTGPFGAQSRIEYVSGNVFVGPSNGWNPVVRFDVVDQANTGNVISIHAFAGTPQSGVRTTAIWGETNNPTGRALQGFNFASTGAGAGIWAETASSTGNGIRARATSTVGVSTAGYFDNASSTGYGIFSSATSATPGATPIAIWGNCVSTTGYSGYFTGAKSYFQSNVGFGTLTPNNPVHVVGSDAQACLLATNSSTAAGNNAGGASGVTGIISSTSPGSFSGGVWGINNSTGNAGAGVAGYHAGTGFGVYGNASNSAGYGGVFDRRVFVNGDFSSAGTGFFLGNLTVQGSLAKGGGSFKIDHPVDPANKYLYHSFVESPDMMNIYNGNVVTDADGYATVTMPDWFSPLNRDFRYQVSVIDENAPDMHFVRVARKLSGNTFVIKSIPGNLEVSWQITGIRHDAWAEKNRIPVEVTKTGNEKGQYLHPEAFGLPASQGIGAHQIPTQLLEQARAQFSAPKSAARPAVPVTAPLPPQGMNEPPLSPVVRNSP